MKRRFSLFLAITALVLAVFAFTGSVLQMGLLSMEAEASSVRPPSNAVTNAPAEPGVQRESDVIDAMNPAKAATSLVNQGPNSPSTIWGRIRAGDTMSVSIPDERAAMLVQDAGMGWLEMRAKGGPLQVYGGYALGGIFAALLLFYLIRGRVRIHAGPSNTTIERFKAIERFAHWVLAVSFIVLAASNQT